MNKKKWHVISYDICEPKRYRACLRKLKDKALFVQRSVCLVHMTKAELDTLFVELSNTLNFQEDDLRGYPIGSLNRLTLYGQNNWQDTTTIKSTVTKVINTIWGTT